MNNLEKRIMGCLTNHPSLRPNPISQQCPYPTSNPYPSPSQTNKRTYLSPHPDTSIPSSNTYLNPPNPRTNQSLSANLNPKPKKIRHKKPLITLDITFFEALTSLIQKGHLKPLELGKPAMRSHHGYNASKYCDYHQDHGHETNTYKRLHYDIQDLIDQKIITPSELWHNYYHLKGAYSKTQQWLELDLNDKSEKGK